MNDTPWARDALLVVEVADSSLRYDREVKIGYYAASRVPEVWIVDVRKRCLHAYRDPAGETYRVADTLAAGATAVCAALPAVAVGVDELFAAGA